MPAIPKELLVKIGARSAELEKAGARSQAVLKRIGSSALDVTRKIAGIAAGSAAIGYGLKRAFLDPFSVQQDALASLSQALASTGKVGVESVGAIADEAARLQKLTTQGDEALIKASATLATLAPSLQTDELVRAQTAIVAIADTFLKGDVEQAATLMGKTLGSSTNALSRYGIQVDASASASEKLAAILGSESLGAAFDVAQAKAKTFSGRVTQLKNATGDLREVIGEILLRTVDLTGGSEDLTERLQALTKRIQDNSDRWVAWGRVVIESVKFSAEVLKGLVRVAFNVGELIGRALDMAASLMIGAFAEAFETIKRRANELLEDLDSLPFLDVGFRFDTRAGENPFFANAREQAEAFKGDLADIGDAVGGVATAWLRVQEAAERARTAAGNTTAAQMQAAAPPGPGSSAGSGGGRVVVPGVDFRDAPELNTTMRTGADIPDTLERAGRKAGEAAEEFTVASDVVVGSFQSMAQAAIDGSGQMEVAIISAIQNVVANIQSKKTGDLFGSTLPGLLVGAGLGIIGSIFGRGGRDRDRPVPVRLEEVSPNASRAMEPPDVQVLINGRTASDEEMRQLGFRLRRLERKDAVDRTPAGAR